MRLVLLHSLWAFHPRTHPDFQSNLFPTFLSFLFLLFLGDYFSSFALFTSYFQKKKKNLDFNLSFAQWVILFYFIFFNTLLLVFTLSKSPSRFPLLLSSCSQYELQGWVSVQEIMNEQPVITSRFEWIATRPIWYSFFLKIIPIKYFYSLFFYQNHFQHRMSQCFLSVYKPVQPKRMR